MLIGNETPFAAIGFGDLHRNGISMAVVVVRATYEIDGDGRFSVAPEQAIVFSDIYEGDPHRTSLVQPNDLAGFKPAADVTILGHAYPPNGHRTKTWVVSIEIGNHRAALRVCGPRSWQPTFKHFRPTWCLGDPEPVESVPLDYRLASGGRLIGDPTGDCDARNPIGPGIIDTDWTAKYKTLRAPQIDSVVAAVGDPLSRPVPQGFGPIPPWWLHRERYSGTRDEAWIRDRHPIPPEDFDYRHEQVAHPNLILSSLRGDEAIRLLGLTKNGSLNFNLPGVAIVAHHRWFDGRQTSARLTLDGLHIDLRASEPPWQVAMTWRGWIVPCPAYNGAIVSTSSLGEAASLPVSNEYGMTDLDDKKSGNQLG